MRLKCVQIRNFRSVEDVTIEFDPRCRVLVGINESGKSNILRALALLDRSRKPQPDDVRDLGPDEDADQEAFVRFVFTLDKAEREGAMKAFAKDVAGDINRPLVKVGGTPRTLAEFFDLRSEVLESVQIPSGRRVQNGWALPTVSKYTVDASWKVPKSTLAATYTVADEEGNERRLSEFKLVHTAMFKELPADDLEDVSASALNQMVFKAQWDHVKEAVPGCVYWSYSDEHLLPAQVDIAKFSATPGMCAPLQHMFALAGFDEPQKAIANAEKRPNGMRNLLERVSTLTTEHMRKVWPDYSGIRIDLAQNGDNIDAFIKDTYNAYDLARRSDGFKRFVSFLLLVSARVKSDDLTNVLYLHDEPDISLHPSGARFLRDELIAMSSQNYVVYSTHSPYMIDRENIGRHLVIRKQREVTTTSRVDSSTIADDEVIYNALGTSVFEVLKPVNIIFEGWRDKRLFEVATSKPLSTHKKLQAWAKQIGRCHAKGVKDVGRIAPMLELANRGCVIVSDGDKTAVEYQRQYEGYGIWFRYDELLPASGVLTGEDFIVPAVILAATATLNVELPGTGELTVADLAIDGGRLARIERWMEQRGVPRDDRKSRLNELKDALFRALEPAHIERRYYDALEVLRGRVEGTQPAP